MARKTGSTLWRRQGRSWAALGVDTSMTAISLVVTAYDALTGSHKGPFWGEVRWMPEDDYFHRLGAAVKAHTVLYDVLKDTWVRDADDIYIAIEEPWFYGAVKTQESGWLKQQAEIAGAFKGGLVNQGYLNIYEINNSQWHATLRKDGVAFDVVAKGSTKKEKDAIRLGNKFKVKEWAMQAYSLPDLPDLVKNKNSAKIPRPETGFGANAKAVQPSDVYDAAACCAWMADMIDTIREGGN